MGINQSRNAILLKFVKQQWRLQKQINKIKIYRNIYDGKEVQLHEVMINSSVNFEQELQIYNYRRIQDSALVSIYAVDHQYQQSSTCGYQGKLYVYVQRIPFRFRDLPHLKLRQILYILCQSIRGFATCFKNVGLFKITNKMIGINQKGHAKVWLNDNFGQNFPSDQKINLQTTSTINLKMNTHRHQLDMLHILLKIIQQKCQTGKYPSDFHRIIYQASNFEEAYQQIQNYCRQQNINVPDRIMCDDEIVHNEHRYYQNKHNYNKIIPLNQQSLVYNQNIDSSSYHSSNRNLINHNKQQLILYQNQNKQIGTYGKQGVSSMGYVPYIPYQKQKISYQYQPQKINSTNYNTVNNVYNLQQGYNNTNLPYIPLSSYNNTINQSYNYSTNVQPPHSLHQISYQPKQSPRQTIIDNVHQIKSNSNFNVKYSSKFNNNNNDNISKIVFGNPLPSSSKINYQFPTKNNRFIQTNHVNFIQSPVKISNQYSYNQDHHSNTGLAGYQYQNKMISMPQLASFQSHQPNQYQSASYLPASHQFQSRYQIVTPDYSSFNMNNPSF